MPEIPAELFAAVIDAIERRVEENYREVDGNPLRVNPHAVAVIAAPAALVAIEEQGYAIVPAAGLRDLLDDHEELGKSVSPLYGSAMRRGLRVALSGTAPQPSETPQDAQTAGGGISGRSDASNASAGLSDARAEEALNRVVQHAHNLASYRPVEADALAALEEQERTRG